MRKVIVNTTPLIALAGIGQLDLLRLLYSEIMIPEAVRKSSVSRHDHWFLQQTGSELRLSQMLHRNPLSVPDFMPEKSKSLYWHRKKRQIFFIMDDNAAKKTAKYLGLTVTGTMGVILRAKKEGLISEVKPLLDGLLNDGLYVSPTVQKYVLEQAGEK